MEDFFAFKECDACAKQANETPILCESCINNNGAIQRLHTSLGLSRARIKDVAALYTPLSIFVGFAIGVAAPPWSIPYVAGLLVGTTLFRILKSSLKR